LFDHFLGFVHRWLIGCEDGKRQVIDRGNLSDKENSWIIGKLGKRECDKTGFLPELLFQQLIS
jgi:hypothetical protein